MSDLEQVLRSTVDHAALSSRASLLLTHCIGASLFFSTQRNDPRENIRPFQKQYCDRSLSDMQLNTLGLNWQRDKSSCNSGCSCDRFYHFRLVSGTKINASDLNLGFPHRGHTAAPSPRKRYARRFTLRGSPSNIVLTGRSGQHPHDGRMDDTHDAGEGNPLAVQQCYSA
jgi:hypothetical protein